MRTKTTFCLKIMQHQMCYNQIKTKKQLVSRRPSSRLTSHKDRLELLWFKKINHIALLLFKSGLVPIMLLPHVRSEDMIKLTRRMRILLPKNPTIQPIDSDKKKGKQIRSRFQTLSPLQRHQLILRTTFELMAALIAWSSHQSVPAALLSMKRETRYSLKV